MNKSMQNSYLVGCMQSTLASYDYHIGSLLLHIRLSKISIQLVIFVYQESKIIWKMILHIIQKFVINKSLGHQQTLQCYGCKTSFQSYMKSFFKVEIKYTFQIISKDKKSTTYTRNMHKVLLEMFVLLHINIQSIYGGENSKIFLFLGR